MATKIRLKRTGSKNNAHYRLVVMDSRKPRDADTVEEIGYYDPGTNPATVQMDVNRALDWLTKGAQPSDTARSLLSQCGVMEAFRNGVKPGELEQPEVIRPEALAASMDAASDQPDDAADSAVEPVSIYSDVATDAGAENE